MDLVQKDGNAVRVIPVPPLEWETTRVADSDFVNFDKALRELKLSEDQLKRLVSEGEIRAIRGDNNTMRFRKEEIERLKQDTGKTLQYTEESSDTLTDDLLFDEADDLEMDEEGMATAQISSEDTFVGDDTGMTTAPLSGSAPVVPSRGRSSRKGSRGGAKKNKGGQTASRPSPAATRGSTQTVRRTTGRSTRMRQAELDGSSTGIGMGTTIALVVTFLVCAFALFVWWDTAKGFDEDTKISSPTRGIANWAGETFADIKAKGKAK